MDYFWLGFALGNLLQLVIYRLWDKKRSQAHYDKAVQDGINRFYREFPKRLLENGIKTLVVKEGGDET